jgi:ribonuclease D
MTASPDLNYTVIKTARELEQFLCQLADCREAAVDLEADSMYHFKEKVCLLQIAADGSTVVIDPIKVNDLSPLAPFFADDRCRKVFHGADYDVRSLYRDFKIEISNLFDTQLAAQFIGLKETGLEAVLARYFGVSLDKKYQRKDWSQRPLPISMIDYAARDVRYLLPLAQLFEDTLRRYKRLEWVEEECERLCQVRPATLQQEPLFLKFRGAGKLQPRALAVLEALLQYRRQIAAKKDRPLFKVFSNQSLLQIAMKQPVSLTHLQKLNALSQHQVKIFGKPIVKKVKQALQLSPHDLPIYPRKKAPVVPAAVPQRIQILKAWRQEKAIQLNLEPGLLCNNALINNLALADPKNSAALVKIPEMKKWQRDSFGHEIVALLSQSPNV